MKKNYLFTLFRPMIGKKSTLLLTLSAFVLSFQLSAQLIGWDPSGFSSQFGPSPFAPATLNTNLTMVTGLSRGSSIATGSTPPSSCWGGSGGWGTNDAGSFFFVFKVKPGFQLSLSSITASLRRSNGGPTSMQVEYSISGGTYGTVATWTAFTTSGTTGSANSATLSTISALQNIQPGVEVRFRFTFPGASGGNCYFTGATNSLRLNGTLTPIAVCNVPTNLAENNVTDATADFDWDASGTNNFEYVLNQTATYPSGAGTAISGVTYSTTALLPSTTYYFHLRKNCGSGSFSDWVLVNFTTPAAPVTCTIPTNTTASNTTYQSSDISWDTHGTNTFEYVLNQSNAAPSGSGTAITGTAYNPSTLLPATTYYFHLRTDCGNGNFSDWATYSFTTTVTPCALPAGITSDNITHESAELTWNISGISTFEYILDENNTTPSGTGTATAFTTYDPSGLSPLTTYYFHLRTDCGNGNFSDWAIYSFTTTVTPCPLPTGITISNVTHESAELAWDNNGNNAFEYVLDQIAVDPTTAGTEAIGTTYFPTALLPLTTYHFHLRADCGNGNYSDWVTLSFTTTVTPCIAPLGITSANVTQQSANLSWSTNGTNTFEYILDQNNATPAVSGTATTGTSYNATTLLPATTYYFHLRTDCGNGNFSDWTTVPFTTSATPAPCLAPLGLTSANITSQSANILWNSNGSNTFEYVLNQNAGNPSTAGTTATGTTHNPAALTPATTYYFHIRTNCGNGNYSDWTTHSFTTRSTLGVDDLSMFSFQVFPNPASNQLMIQTATAQGMIKLINAKGEQLWIHDLAKGNSIDLSNTANGLYFLIYEFNDHTSSVKLIVAH